MVKIISYLKVNISRPKLFMSITSCTCNDELPVSEYESFNGGISVTILQMVIIISYLEVNISRSKVFMSITSCTGDNERLVTIIISNLKVNISLQPTLLRVTSPPCVDDDFLGNINSLLVE